jgi:hypothetical protein
VAAVFLKGEKNELAVWQLAGDGWKQVLTNRVEMLTDGSSRGLNTPKANQVQNLLDQALGIPDVTVFWKKPYLTQKKARRKLDTYVTLRGEIAHRAKPNSHVINWQCKDFLLHVTELVGRTDEAVNAHLLTLTGTSFF